MDESHVDETWLACVAEELRDAGCDEMFIECTLDDLREGASVSVVIGGEMRTFGSEDE